MVLFSAILLFMVVKSSLAKMLANWRLQRVERGKVIMSQIQKGQLIGQIVISLEVTPIYR